MGKEKKQLLKLDINELKSLEGSFDVFGTNRTDELFKVVHRNNGVNETFLKNSLHWHDYYEFEFVYEGEGVHILNKTSYKMSRGFSCLRLPSDLHSTIQNPNLPLKLYNVKFTKNVVYIKDFPEVSEYANLTEEELSQAIQIIQSIQHELTNPDDYSYEYAKVKLTELLIMFLRKGHKGAKHDAEKGAYIPIAVSYIHENFRDNISLSKVAESLYLSPNYFGNLFFKETGKTFSEYVLELRFSLATQLLANTYHSVSNIAWESGFNSASYFIRKFTERFGKSPTAYRKELENGNNQIISNKAHST